MSEPTAEHQPRFGTLPYALAFGVTVVAVVVLGFHEDWQVGLFVGLVAVSIGIAPLGVERESESISGAPVVVVLAACVLGPAQAALVGVTAICADMVLYWRREHALIPLRPTLLNLTAFAVFPLAASVVAARIVSLDHGLVLFVTAVTVVYFAGLFVSLVFFAAYAWSEKGTPVREGMSVATTFWAEILAAELSAFGVYVLLVEGALGLLVAAGTLIVFLNLADRFFESIDNKDAAIRERDEAERQRVLAEQHRDDAERLQVLAEDRLAQIEYGYRLQLVVALEALQAKDRSTGRHSAAVSAYLREFAIHRGMSDADVEFCTILGLVHDIGKLEVPERTLSKPARLTEWEMALVREHSEDGAYYVRNLKDGERMAGIIVSHHERWDGGEPGNFWKVGYPDGLAGDDIPEFACMIAVVDTYEAITNRNFIGHYRTHEEALEILREERGKQFRADLVDQFIELLESRPDLRFNPDRGETFKTELERFLGSPPVGHSA